MVGVEIKDLPDQVAINSDRGLQGVSRIVW